MRSGSVDCIALEKSATFKGRRLTSTRRTLYDFRRRPRHPGRVRATVAVVILNTKRRPDKYGRLAWLITFAWRWTKKRPSVTNSAASERADSKYQFQLTPTPVRLSVPSADEPDDLSIARHQGAVRHRRLHGTGKRLRVLLTFLSRSINCRDARRITFSTAARLFGVGELEEALQAFREPRS
jgi:hypothetical protein